MYVTKTDISPFSSKDTLQLYIKHLRFMTPKQNIKNYTAV